MNETELREYLSTLTREQMTEMVVVIMENEERMRKELDEIKGIIR